ncbi:hypothetical protein GW17_00061141 [Ensete ventricosum]|nr:hypothetical protein GW17_00061141 [Ensete ventricosum]
MRLGTCLVCIGSLLGWHKGVHWKKIETRRKIIGDSRKACRELRSGRRWASEKRTRGVDVDRLRPKHYNWMTSFNFASNLEIKSLNKFSHKLYLRPISGLVRQVLKSALVLLYYRSLKDFSELSINVLVLRWSEANQELSLELSPRRDSVIGLVQIIPLDHISFKLNGDDLHLGFLRSPMKMKKKFST